MNKLFNNIFWTVVLAAFCLLLIKVITDSLYKKKVVDGFSDGLHVSVEYSTPAIGDRKIFGYAVPYGIVWRTGADDATEIEFSKDCLFNGKKVKAGQYSLWTIPNKKEWIIILNKETGQYGTDYDAKKDYLRTTAPTKIQNERKKKLDISFKNELGLNLIISWENTRVEVPITISKK